MVILFRKRCRDTRDGDDANVVILGLESGGSSNYKRDRLLVRQQHYRVLTRLVPRGSISGLPERGRGKGLSFMFIFSLSIRP